MMNSVSVQMQRATNDAISNQVSPQMQNANTVGPGHMTKKGSAGRPETSYKVPRSEKTKNDLRSEQTQIRQHNDNLADYNAYDIVTGENKSLIHVPEFLTGRMPSTSQSNQSHDDINPLCDTTIPVQERSAPAVESDPNCRLADVLTNKQNRPTAQQLTIRPVNFNTMNF